MSGGEDARKARLAEALRQNLRRRKTQGREMAADGDDDDAGEPADHDPADVKAP